MALPPTRAISLRLLFLLAMAASAAQAATAAEAATEPCSTTESTSSSESTTAFLRARCATTRYPDVCYDSLLPYASTFQTNHVKLAVAAADVAAAHLRAFSARIKDMLLHHGGVGGGSEEAAASSGSGARVDAALHDCASTISAAANLAKRSSAELTRLDADTASTETATSTPTTAGGSRQARWQVSNAKTWLSAAMTNEGTCSDGFEDAGAAVTASPAAKEVAAGVASVTQHTSNALALVNGIPL